MSQFIAQRETIDKTKPTIGAKDMAHNFNARIKGQATVTP